MGVKTIVRLDYELSDEFELKVWMYQGSVWLPFLFEEVCCCIAMI